VLGGARGTNEDAYVWARFLKGVLKTDNVDAQLGDGLPGEVVLGLPRATIADLDRAAAIVVLAPDLKDELPVLYLRIRRAASELGVPLFDVSARDNGITPYATTVVRHLPGEAGVAVGKLLADLPAEGNVVVVLGRPSLAEPDTAVVHAASQLLTHSNVTFLSALRRGNVHGALDLGLTPGFLPGGPPSRPGSALAEHWGRVPDEVGLDAEGILGRGRRRQDQDARAARLRSVSTTSPTARSPAHAVDAVDA
jgi:NADH-quinone oxidoreductase subunit G